MSNKKYEKFTSAPKSTRYFVDWLLPRVKSFRRNQGGLNCKNNLDVQLQELAESSVNKITAKYESADQSALVALSLNGEILQ